MRDKICCGRLTCHAGGREFESRRPGQFSKFVTFQWGPQRRELFYPSGASLVVVRVETESTFTPGGPKTLWSGKLPEEFIRPYDVHPKAQRFLTMREIKQRDELIIVLNWFEELKRLVPTE